MEEFLAISVISLLDQPVKGVPFVGVAFSLPCHGLINLLIQLAGGILETFKRIVHLLCICDLRHVFILDQRVVRATALSLDITAVSCALNLEVVIDLSVNS